MLSQDGSPITVSPTDGPWDIDSSGNINQAGTRQPLQIAKPASLGDLAKAGENLFRPLGSFRPVAESERAVAGSYLEMSAVQPTTEMTTLIETSRLLEANVNIMKQHNEMLSNLIDRILKA